MLDQIEFYGEWILPESVRLQKAFEKTEKDEHNLSDFILKMHGASGIKYRKLINNLVSITPDARYLEIGCWTGSTACSAINNNIIKATCIDNFAWNSKVQLETNLKSVTNDNVEIRLIESDFRKVDYSKIGLHNLYMFDGPHLEQDQFDGVNMVLEALDKCFILIVDDYNAPEVRRGTLNAITQSNLEIVSSITITTPNTGPRNENSDWHFGYFISVIKKKNN